MTVKLDHCNIRTFDLEETVRFYSDIVGLKEGEAPMARPVGAWLYDDSGRPVLHVLAVDRANPGPALSRIRDRLGDLAGALDPASLAGGGAVDHIAFECNDYDAMATKLAARKLTFTRAEVPRIGLRQLFVNDPSGITLELNFR